MCTPERLLAGASCAGASAGALSAGGRERVTAIEVPLPGVLSTVMRPSISSTRRLTIESPRPVPTVLLSVEVRSRSNASNICS